VPLLVDAAAGFGAEADDGQPLGRQGDAEVFSFHATKPFAVGEGGLVVARDPDVAERVGQLANFGLGRGREVVGDPGLNAKLSELQCATALAVLDGYPEVLRARRASADTMRSALERAGCRFQLGCERATWQFVPMAVEADRRAGILDRASAGGVELRTYYEPLHRFPAFAHHPRLGELAVTEDLGRRMVSLPMSNRLDDEARDRIVAVVALDSQPARRTPA
jgi:dTDP-4-amino-4,6-dideoxygalactose transaminase